MFLCVPGFLTCLPTCSGSAFGPLPHLERLEADAQLGAPQHRVALGLVQLGSQAQGCSFGEGQLSLGCPLGVIQSEDPKEGAADSKPGTWVPWGSYGAWGGLLWPTQREVIR